MPAKAIQRTFFIRRPRLFAIFLCPPLIFLLVWAIQTGTQPMLMFYTDTVTSLPSHLYRALSFKFGGRHQQMPELPTKRAKQLILPINISTIADEMKIISQNYPSYNSCIAVREKAPPKRVATNIYDAPGVGSLSWRMWSDKQGTKNAPFWAAWLQEKQESQEFPAFPSKTPCGIHEVSRVKVGHYDQVVVAGKGNGTAFVLQMDTESNPGHALRSGVALCAYLLSRIVHEQHATPLTFLVYWPEVGANSVSPFLLDYKLQTLRALGNVVHFHKKNPGFKNAQMNFLHVYTAPWNGLKEKALDSSLSQGLIQQALGEGALRLSLSSVIVNRKPLRMYVGFSSAIRDGLRVETRPKDSGAVVILQRGTYYEGDNPNTKRDIRAKQRLMVDSASGTSEGLLHGLCRSQLPIRVLDFHPSAKAPLNTFKEQVRIMGNAAVLSSSHGSGLWNAIWMRPDSVVIEVTLRTGHCCHPIPKAFWKSEEPCTSPCRPYTFINIADGIAASGVRWFYYDPLYIDQPTGDTARDTERVHVDVGEYTKLIVGAYYLATGRSRTTSEYR